MKTIKKMIALIFLTILLLTVSIIEAVEQSWKVAFQTYLPPSMYYYVGFENSLLGIAVGVSGDIQYTTDSGKSWITTGAPTLCLFGLDIFDDSSAWTCGNGGHVLFSGNKAKRWEPLTSFGYREPLHPKFVSFCDKSNGLIGTCKSIAFTSDNGKKWIAIKNPPNLEEIASLFLLSPEAIFVLDSKGSLSITKNKGETWQQRMVHFENKTFTVSNNKHKMPICGMRFFNNNEGVIATVAKKPKNELLVFRTSDSAMSWKLDRVNITIELREQIYINRTGKIITTKSVDDQITVLNYSN